MLLAGDKLAAKKCGGLGMKLNCIQWGGYSSGDQGSVEYPFISITPRSTLTRNGRTC